MDKATYAGICEHIISSTMKYISTDRMKCISISRETAGHTDNPIYASAIMSKAPITLAYTPAGTGKSALIKDRADATAESGIDKSRILVLNMNIAKAKEMSHKMTGMQVMTFSDFTCGIIEQNFPADDEYFIFRARTVTNAEGRVTSAHFGRIGETPSHMSGLKAAVWFNQDENDTNLEDGWH